MPTAKICPTWRFFSHNISNHTIIKVISVTDLLSHPLYQFWHWNCLIFPNDLVQDKSNYAQPFSSLTVWCLPRVYQPLGHAVVQLLQLDRGYNPQVLYLLYGTCITLSKETNCSALYFYYSEMSVSSAVYQIAGHVFHAQRKCPHEKGRANWFSWTDSHNSNTSCRGCIALQHTSEWSFYVEPIRCLRYTA